MRKILKMRWAMIAVWLILAAVLTAILPNLNRLINEKGNVMLDDHYPSQQAAKLMENLSTTKGTSGILVFYNQNTLSAQDKESIKQGLQRLKDQKDKIGITGTVDVFDTPEAESEMISGDKTTMIAQVAYEKNGRDISEVKSAIEDAVGDVSVTHYLTGDEFISSDYVTAVMDGVEKSALLTVAFILIVLILMFRSVVTPLISLATVGISYLVSIGIVGQLVARLGFPISSLTQMFIILILFGIGTDYNILLFNRFKEELHNTGNVDDAIVMTYKTAGKTVLYSALTVFIAFASLQFVKFGVYRSAVAVAISVAVLIAVQLTLMPAVFKLLGKKLFWPSKNAEGHGQNRVWEKVTAVSVRRPYLGLAAVAVVLLPVMLVTSYKLTFNNLDDMGGATSPAVNGFNVVAEHFGDGKIMPTTIVISSDKAMDNNDDLAALDALTQKLSQIDGVASVSGPTRPQGKEIADFYTDSQTKQVTSGLDSANDGIEKIADGLTTMHDQLSAPDFSQVEQLASGTTAIEKGLSQITAGLSQIDAGMKDSASGASDISGGIKEIADNLGTISNTLNGQLLPGYQGLKSGMDLSVGGYSQLQGGLSGLVQMAEGIQKMVDAIGPSIPQTDPAYLYYQPLIGENGMLSQLINNLKKLNEQFIKANTGLNTMAKSFNDLNSGLAQISAGLPKMTDGLRKLQEGAAGLSQGLGQASGGQQEIIANMNKMTDAMHQIAAGQTELSKALSTVGGSLTQLKDGIGASRDGLHQVSDGIVKANAFLGELASVKSFHIPDEAVGSSDLNKAFDAFMSGDRKTAELSVTLKDDPYSDKAVHTVSAINAMLGDSLGGTSLSDAKVLAGGQTAATGDLKQVATSDMRTTQLIVLISIFIVLIIVTRSFWIPVFITGSILATYYSTITLTSLIAKGLLHVNELSWNVPFFAFLMIVTLGVDYSIFLMTRFREYRGITPHEAIIRASANVGTVVLSAALILAGTFATIIPAGIHTLVQLAVAVCIGIALLSLIFLPLVIPACISVQDFLNRKFGFDAGGTEKADYKNLKQ